MLCTNASILMPRILLCADCMLESIFCDSGEICIENNISFCELNFPADI